MRTSPTKSNPVAIQEITGRSATQMINGFGISLRPGLGSMTLKISGDLLHAVVDSPMNKRESWTRIQNIDSIEIVQAPIWELLILGLGFLFLGIPRINQVLILGMILGMILTALGGGAIVAFILFKYRYLCIHSHRATVAVCLTKPPQIYQLFAMNVMALSRQLNTLRIVSPQATGNTIGRTASPGSTSGRTQSGLAKPVSGGLPSGVNTGSQVPQPPAPGHSNTQLQ